MRILPGLELAYSSKRLAHERYRGRGGASAKGGSSASHRMQKQTRAPSLAASCRSGIGLKSKGIRCTRTTLRLAMNSLRSAVELRWGEIESK
jgi:hypothetical protein